MRSGSVTTCICFIVLLALTVFACAPGLILIAGPWALFEIGWLLLQHARLRKLNAVGHEVPTDDVGERIRQFLTLQGVIDIRAFLEGWFMNAPLESIKRDNLLDFVAYGFWYKERKSMPEREHRQVEAALDALLATFDFSIADGYNPELRFMDHLVQPLRVMHKPLFVYLVAEASVVVSHCVLATLGFRCYWAGGLAYWARNCPPPLTPPPVHSRGGDGRLAWLDRSVDPFASEVAAHNGRVAGGQAVDGTSDHTRRLHTAIASASRAARTGLHILAGAAAPDGLEDLLRGRPEPLRPLHSQDAPGATVATWKRLQPDWSWRAISGILFGVTLPGGPELESLFSTDSATAAEEGRMLDPPAMARSTRDQEPVARRAENQAGNAPDVGHAPLVFLHGVGFGLLPYLGFIWKLSRAFSSRPIIVLEVRHVSLRICSQARRIDDIARSVVHIIRRHGASRCHLVAHSFGTFVVAQLCHLYPDVVLSSLLADPVCLLTCCPQLLSNFIYRDPAGPIGMLRAPMDALKLAIARDLIIAHAFSRHFFWHTLMLWPDELPRATVLSLSCTDELVPCTLVQRQVVAAANPRTMQPRIVVNPGRHGVLILQPGVQDKIIAEFQDALREAGMLQS